MNVHKPEIWTDGGLWAEHDHACSVCHVNKSVLDIGTALFHPCWDCQELGWKLGRVSWWPWRKLR